MRLTRKPSYQWPEYDHSQGSECSAYEKTAWLFAFILLAAALTIARYFLWGEV